MTSPRPTDDPCPCPAAPGLPDAKANLVEPSDAELCRRLARGRQPAARDALAALHARHAGALFAFLPRRRPDWAEDLLQETCLLLAGSAGQFEGASARPWLLAIARSRLARAARSERTAAEHHTRYAADRATRADQPHADVPLGAALERLAPEHAEVLELRFMQDLTHAETAALLGVSLRTAKTRAAAALDALHRALLT